MWVALECVICERLFRSHPAIEAALLWRWSKPMYEYGPDAFEAQPMAASGLAESTRRRISFLPASIAGRLKENQGGSSL
jgi:hypothetical protein